MSFIGGMQQEKTLWVINEKLEPKYHLINIGRNKHLFALMKAKDQAIPI